MTAAIAISRVSLRQLVGRRRVLGLLLLALVPVGIYVLAVQDAGPANRVDIYAGILTSFVFGIVAPVSAISMSATALGGERRDGTLSFLLLKPVPRWVVVAAKMVAAWLAAFAISATSGGLLAIAYALAADDWTTLVPTIVGLAISTAAYVAVFVPLGYLVRRAVIIGLVYVFIWESIAGGLEGLAPTSLWRIGFSGFAGMVRTRILIDVEGYGLGSVSPGLGGAIVKVAILLILGVVIASQLLSRRDVTGET
ncbi:MAG: ABC transporter permease subunit [Acidimicrobiia bacterium]|nr:ABC transporter permease subunit [Acidimicrobiia bacterium]